MQRQAPQKMTREQRVSFDAAYLLLLSYGLIHFEHDSPDYRAWAQACIDLKPDELTAGAQAAKDFRGFFKLGDFRAFCKQQRPQMPDPYEAYLEACNAPKPREDHKWSHPGVYHAGVACGWSFLASTAIPIAYPRWKVIYAEIARRVEAGEALDVPVVERLELKQPEPSTRGQAGYQRFRELMQDLDLHPEARK